MNRNVYLLLIILLTACHDVRTVVISKDHIEEWKNKVIKAISACTSSQRRVAIKAISMDEQYGIRDSFVKKINSLKIPQKGSRIIINERFYTHHDSKYSIWLKQSEDADVIYIYTFDYKSKTEDFKEINPADLFVRDRMLEWKDYIDELPEEVKIFDCIDNGSSPDISFTFEIEQ